MYDKNIWLKTDTERKEKIEIFSDKYKKFLENKTEIECVSEIEIMAQKKGFISIEDRLKNNKPLVEGEKIYFKNMKKNIVLFIIGKDIKRGLKIITSHIDSPRLDLKQNPLYKEQGFALFDTHYYGGIKKYQWVATPLSMHSIINKSNGESFELIIGEKDDEPVFCITDLLIHLSNAQLNKPARDVILGEDLNIICGNISIENIDEKQNILNILNQKFNIEEKDFFSSEIEFVPAGKPKNLGFDNSMILAYGHDDRVCAFTSLKAILNTEYQSKTLVCMMVDKEEVGSLGATSANSMFFQNSVLELLKINNEDSIYNLRKIFENSEMISADVTNAVDPNYIYASPIKNSAFLSKGVSLSKYTGSGGKSNSSDANGNYVAKIINIFEKNNLNYQISELGKVDQGGGGTIAYIMANYNINVVDCGVPVLCMHSPYEIVSKADVFEFFLFCESFYKSL